MNEYPVDFWTRFDVGVAGQCSRTIAFQLLRGHGLHPNCPTARQALAGSTRSAKSLRHSSHGRLVAMNASQLPVGSADQITMSDDSCSYLSPLATRHLSPELKRHREEQCIALGIQLGADIPDVPKVEYRQLAQVLLERQHKCDLRAQAVVMVFPQAAVY